VSSSGPARLTMASKWRRIRQADLERELERAAGAVDQFGDQKLPAMAVEPPQRLAHHIDRHDAGDDRMLFAQRAPKARRTVPRRHVQFVAQVFRGLFEFGEIIAVGLDQVAHALDRVGLESACPRRGRPFARRPASRRGGPRYRRRTAVAMNESHRGTIRRDRAVPASAGRSAGTADRRRSRSARRRSGPRRRWRDRANRGHRSPPAAAGSAPSPGAGCALSG
jgi:hypothetical protein